MDIPLNKLLSRVERPSRYIGDEFGLPAPTPGQGDPRLRLALGFPDVYEVGMSHLGFRQLHASMLELADEGIRVQRAFMPYADMQRLLVSEGLPLFTLEDQTPLGEMDLLGLSVQYELAYPALLRMLDLGQIPRRTADRLDPEARWPLVLLGGSAALNPEPLAPFVDLVFLGEADEALPELARALADIGPDAPRRERLARLSRVEGIYVPEWVDVDHDPTGLAVKVTSCAPDDCQPLPVRRRLVQDLDSLPLPAAHLVPSCPLVHDRVVLEIQRGCSQGCRFCQAGFVTRPTRQRSQERVLSEARRLLDQTGYQDLALLSLSAGDHPQLLPMLCSLIQEHGPRNIAVSLPSLRTETLDSTVAREISKVRQTSFTLAPEAATDRLRRVINKQNSDEDLLAAVASVFEAGYGRLKLYFMLGLPTETDEDLLAIASLAERAHRRAKQIRPQATISVSVSTFVPKPHTAFQWEAGPTLQEVERKLELLRRAMPRRVRPFRWHHPGQSVAESYLARGDRRMASVLERVVTGEHTGLDAWTEHFELPRWQAALEGAHQAGEIPDPALYLGPRAAEATLPWDHLDFGVQRRYLAGERRAASSATTRQDCTFGDCDQCGVCPDEPEHRLFSDAVAPVAEAAAAEQPLPEQAAAPVPKTTVRIWFNKHGRAALIGHLEMMVVFERAARRAGFPLRFSKGYHPKPKLRFSPALPLGAESRCEFVEVELCKPGSPDELRDALAAQLPPGLTLERAELGSEPVLTRIQGIRWSLGPPRPLSNEDVERARQRLAAGPLEFVRGKKRKKRDMSRIIARLDLRPDGAVEVLCRFGADGTVKPEEVLRHLLGVEEEDLPRCAVARLGWDLKALDP